MRRILLLGLLLACGLCPGTRAANITLTTLPTTNVIILTGPITSGDAARFQGIVPIPGRPTMVLLASPGGNLVEALAIGMAIRRNNWITYVPFAETCASACGYIWLGGTRRAVSPTARIGFHAAYVVNGSGVRESGIANARVGAYLTVLGLPLAAVDFVTSAPPDQMRWLHPQEAHAIGIEMKLIATAPGRLPTAPAGVELKTPRTLPDAHGPIAMPR